MTNGQTAQKHGHERPTRELIALLEDRPEFRALLEESIERAKAINPDHNTNPAQTLEEYYAFIDWAAKAMPWSILRGMPHSGLYEQIDQSLDYFYFINDQPLPALEGKGYYHNSLQYMEPYRSWLIDFTRQWGAFLSTPASWSDEYYRRACADERFGLQKGWYEDPAHWKSFNQFFARYLRSPDARPIAAPEDASVVASPADALPQGAWAIGTDNHIVEEISIKSNVFTSVATLIGEGSAYCDAFAGGTLTHTFLDVNDYHRYHFPVGGVIREVRLIPHDDAVGGRIVWDSKRKKYILDDRTPGWQDVETRGCVIVETAAHGLVAILPIAMSQVSSVNFEKPVRPGAIVKKGDMLGYFLFGGSDIVMLFQQEAGFLMDPPPYNHLLMGEAYGNFV